MKDNEKQDFELFHLFEMTPDLVCIADRAGYFRSVNNAVLRKLGYSREELFSRPIASFIHPADRDRTGSRRSELLEGKALVDFDNRYLTKGGDTVWLHWTSIYIPEKELVFAIAKDVTDRKTKEQEVEEKYLRFKNLTAHFKVLLETDKARLAAELHEELAQTASAVKTNLHWVQEQGAGSTATRDKLDQSLALLDGLVHSIRRLSYSIAPNMMEAVGLNETLCWLCEEFTRVGGIPCFFESGLEEETLSLELRLDLFRICQEALGAVFSHAGVQAVTVSLEALEAGVRLSIADEGRGRGAGEGRAASALENIRQRVASVNGQLRVESSEGGTRVVVVL